MRGGTPIGSVLAVAVLALLLGLVPAAQGQDQPAAGSGGPSLDQLKEIQKEIVDGQPSMQPEGPTAEQLGSETEHPLRVPDGDESQRVRASEQKGPDAADAERGREQDRSSSLAF